ncbi:hypothetical protein [Streptomyces sp. TRM49041]|uniref:hypothetical protein n=1 Tax=Streptomyces sp. TRM49041 TaxID=2603216 RepID=UPI0021CCE939|nr:hypothetical protein [Streptomyces sp. TRM49041]
MVHKSPGRRPRTTALAAAAILVLAPLATACGDDNGDEVPEQVPVPTPTATVTGTTSSPATDQPADPAAARQEIERNWETFFEPETATDERVRVLEDGEEMRSVLTAYSGDPTAAQTSAQVQNITFTSATQAEVTYHLMTGGATALPDVQGTAVLQDGTWKVSRNTLCALVKLSGNPDVEGC